MGAPGPVGVERAHTHTHFPHHHPCAGPQVGVGPTAPQAQSLVRSPPLPPASRLPPGPAGGPRNYLPPGPGRSMVMVSPLLSPRESDGVRGAVRTWSMLPAGGEGLPPPPSGQRQALLGSS